MAKRGMVVIIVQPTIELIDKTINEELLNRPDPPPHRVFHGHSVSGGVAKQLADYLRCPEDGGQIIFTTHSVLQYVPYWTNKKNLHLLIDEELQAVRNENHRLPHTHELITKYLNVVSHDAIYGTVIADDAAIDAMARNKEDDEVFALFAETLRTITNDNWECYVNLEHYAKLQTEEGCTLAVHSVLKPDILDGFGSVFMAAAELEDTFIYQLWTEAGVDFVQDREFTESLLYTGHPNGDLITFYYATTDNWSKRLRSKRLDDGNVLDLMLAGAAKLFEGTNFVWQANAEYTGDPFGPLANRLPNKPHGLNSYSHLHNIVFASSLNPRPDHIKFLQSRALSSAAIRACIYYSTCYQAMMRISTRNPHDTNPKRILVPDLGAAEYLQGLFPESKIQWLETGIPVTTLINNGGRPRKHESNAARRSHQRRAAREKKLNTLRQLAKVSQDHLIKDEGSEGAENPIDIISTIGTAVAHGSLFTGKNQSLPFGFVCGDDNDSLVQLLYDVWSGNILVRKEDNRLISPSVFDPALCSEHDRGLENIVYCRHVWLDFENGDLKPEDFPKLFPNLRMVITNTFGHTKENPRFRAVILTTNILTREAYNILQSQIIAKLEDAGYSVDAKPKVGANTLRSGLDTGKNVPSSLFYLPCQVEDSADNCFRYYAGDDTEFLDAARWIENGLIPLAPEPVEWVRQDHEGLGSINQDAVDAAIALWRSTPADQGHEAFFQLAVELRGAGMGAGDIQTTLKTQAGFGRTPRERKAEIPGIMKSLRGSRAPLKA